MSFCKIYESQKYGTVLVYRGYDPDQDTNIVSITIEHSNCLVEASINVETVENMNTVYDNMDLETAEGFLGKIIP